jgi:hypothetical protein
MWTTFVLGTGMTGTGMAFREGDGCSAGFVSKRTLSERFPFIRHRFVTREPVARRTLGEASVLHAALGNAPSWTAEGSEAIRSRRPSKLGRNERSGSSSGSADGARPVDQETGGEA